MPPPPQTPTRRSKRFQPLATPSRKHDITSQLHCAWEGDPIHTRPTYPVLDLLQEEQEDLEGKSDQEEQETVFYSAFRMRSQKARQYRGEKRTNNSGLKTFRVGDTVTVETDTFYRKRKPPSIAVIVSMWRTRSKKDDDGDGELDPSKLRLRVHWFLRPTEMPSVRAKREHNEVRKAVHLVLIY